MDSSDEAAIHEFSEARQPVVLLHRFEGLLGIIVATFLGFCVLIGGPIAVLQWSMNSRPRLRIYLAIPAGALVLVLIWLEYVPGVCPGVRSFYQLQRQLIQRYVELGI